MAEKALTSWWGMGLVLTAFLWCCWPNLRDLWQIWQRSDEYSSGLLVPFLAGYVIWSRRRDIATCPIRPSLFWGLLLLLAAQAFRFFGLFFMFGSAERLSIIITIVALVLLLFGWRITWKISTILLFLLLMVPWPNRIQAAVAQPLQRWATTSAVFLLEVFGYNVVREGNIISIGQTSVAVAEACNGLRMIMAFFVIGGLVVLLARRPFWQKLIVLISSLPVALFCNTVRLAFTAVAFTRLTGENWQMIFHDFGGYAMMPLALTMTVAEFWLMTKLTVPSVQVEKVVISRQNLSSD